MKQTKILLEKQKLRIKIRNNGEINGRTIAVNEA